MWIVILIAVIILYCKFRKPRTTTSDKPEPQYRTPRDAYEAETNHLYKKAFQEIQDIRNQRKYVFRPYVEYLMQNLGFLSGLSFAITEMPKKRERDKTAEKFLSDVESQLLEALQADDPEIRGEAIRAYMSMTDKTKLRVRMQFACEPKGYRIPEGASPARMRPIYPRYDQPLYRPEPRSSQPNYDYKPNTEDLDYQAELLRQQQQEGYEEFQARMREQNAERERIDRMRREGLVIEADEAEADFHRKFG